jgi:hypothetical protein
MEGHLVVDGIRVAYTAVVLASLTLEPRCLEDPVKSDMGYRKYQLASSAREAPGSCGYRWR